MNYFVCSLALLVAQPVWAQAQQPPLLPYPRPSLADKEVYDVTQNELGEMSLSFLTPAACAAGEEAQAQQQHESAAQLARRKACLPPGGYLQAAWIRSCAGAPSQLLPTKSRPVDSLIATPKWS
jgi:hypothetical protein